jgi:hypothetical protein
MAETKISLLTELTDPVAGDSLPIVDASTSSTKKVTVATLDGRYVLESDVAAKGDIFVGTANDTLGVLSVGANDAVLVADSVAATGVKWAALNYVAQNGTIDAVQSLTQAAYDALGTPDATTLYVIVG